MGERKDIEDILNSITQPSGGENPTVGNLMNEWFNPRKTVIKHVIVIQMIACFIVGLFLITTAGDSLSPDGLMLAVIGFMIFVAGAFGVYGKL
jgi:hypothetical protein